MCGGCFWDHSCICCPAGALRWARGARMGSHCWARQCVTPGSSSNPEVGLTCFASWKLCVFLETAASFGGACLLGLRRQHVGEGTSPILCTLQEIWEPLGLPPHTIHTFPLVQSFPQHPPVGWNLGPRKAVSRDFPLSGAPFWETDPSKPPCL